MQLDDTTIYSKNEKSRGKGLGSTWIYGLL